MKFLGIHKEQGFEYRKFAVPKKSGGVRYVYDPEPRLRKRLRRELPYLTRALEQHYYNAGSEIYRDIPQGCFPLRSPVTNALKHVGYDWSLCMDLENFFDCVTWKAVRVIGDPRLRSFLFVEGRAAQGLHTSPVVANLAARRLDARLESYLTATLSHGFAVTRYVDDITVSGKGQAPPQALPALLEQIVKSDGYFQVNPKKTRIMTARHGRRIITGIGVDEHGIYPTRRLKRKLRAAVHQNRDRHANGLREWSLLKTPTGCNQLRKIQRRFRYALRYGRLKQAAELLFWAEVYCPAGTESIAVQHMRNQLGHSLHGATP